MLMDFERELKRVAGVYTAQGYQVVVHPRPEDMPPFANDFTVEIVGRRGAEGVLVAVKRNREEMAADADMPRYAETIGAQPGWRFDFAILEGESPMGRAGRGVRDFSGEDINKVLADAEQMVRMGFVTPAVITAWSGLEAAMRMRLRAAGEDAGWGTMPREMLNELYSSGVFSADEFPQLERVYQLRNQIVHGFSSPTADAETVQLLSEIARRLVEESQLAKQAV
jgi:REase_AHJR-like